VPPVGPHTFAQTQLGTLKEAAAGVRGLAPTYGVGGIALTKAVADRLALNIELEAMYFRDGRIVLVGRDSRTTRIDAALVLTALRLACESGDPFFSLDPVDGVAWNRQSQEATKAVWEQVKDRFSPEAGLAEIPGTRKLVAGLSFRTYAVSRDFATVWSELKSRYPELRVRLVFRPEWLRLTRLGEILYLADLLLKELTNGLAIVQADGPLRAARLPRYIAPYQRQVLRSLLVRSPTKEFDTWTGHRLWFDFIPAAGSADGPPKAHLIPDLDRASLPALYRGLKGAGILDLSTVPVKAAPVHSTERVTDVSQVYPKMFVRRHDHALGQDVAGADPDLDTLAADVNARTSDYIDAYQELRDLTDVFRAYVASIKIVQQDRRVCGFVEGLPLTEEERVQTPLPELHPSELFITAARYLWSDSRSRHSVMASAHSVSGGIGLSGRKYLATAASPA
jgi:hypothetical protein